jgi:hypothetical protein
LNSSTPSIGADVSLFAEGAIAAASRHGELDGNVSESMEGLRRRPPFNRMKFPLRNCPVSPGGRPRRSADLGWRSSDLDGLGRLWTTPENSKNPYFYWNLDDLDDLDNAFLLDRER